MEHVVNDLDIALYKIGLMWWPWHALLLFVYITTTLTSDLSSKQAVQSIINPDWDFNKMGIGGLDNEFSAIFRRAFASRVFPPEIVQQLGDYISFNIM